MKFRLFNVKFFFREGKEEKYKKIGFRFKEDANYGIIIDNTFIPTIEINSIEELVNFTKKYGDIIIDGDGITIYDDYIE